MASQRHQKTQVLDCACSVDNSENFTASQLCHYYVQMPNTSLELATLRYFLEALEYRKAIIFVRDRLRADALAEVVGRFGLAILTTIIHEEMKQRRQKRILERFNDKNSPSNVLLTSCSSHAFECKRVDLIIHFDEARTAHQYHHRICSKQSRKGMVLSFIRRAKYMRVLKNVEKHYKFPVALLPSSISTEVYIEENSDEEV